MATLVALKNRIGPYWIYALLVGAFIAKFRLFPHVPTEGSAEGGLYHDSAEALYDAWAAPDVIINGRHGLLRYLSLFLPFPAAKETLFIYIGAAMKSALSLIGPAYANHPLVWVGYLSILACSLLLAHLAGQTSRLAGLLAGGIFLTIYDVWDLSAGEYQTVFGVALMLAGLAFLREPWTSQRILTASILLSLSAFGSDHNIIPNFLIGAAFLACVWWRHGLTLRWARIASIMAIGAIGPVVLAALTHAFRNAVGLPDIFVLATIFFTYTYAVGVSLDIMPKLHGFFFEYGAFQFGAALFGILVFGWFAALLLPSERNALFERMISLVAAVVIFVETCLMIATGRVLMTPLALFLFSAAIGLCGLSRVFRAVWQRAAWNTALCGLLVLGGSRYVTVSRLAPPFDEAAMERTLSTYLGRPLLPNTAVSDADLPRLETIIRDKIVRVYIGARLLHVSYGNCGFELLLRDLEDAGLEPIATSPKWPDPRPCFENEHAYLGVCKNHWQGVYPEQAAFQSHFNLETNYYFAGNDILRLLGSDPKRDLSAYRCIASPANFPGYPALRTVPVELPFYRKLVQELGGQAPIVAVEPAWSNATFYRLQGLPQILDLLGPADGKIGSPLELEITSEDKLINALAAADFLITEDSPEEAWLLDLAIPLRDEISQYMPTSVAPAHEPSILLLNLDPDFIKKLGGISTEPYSTIEAKVEAIADRLVAMHDATTSDLNEAYFLIMRAKKMLGPVREKAVEEWYRTHSLGVDWGGVLAEEERRRSGPTLPVRGSIATILALIDHAPVLINEPESSTESADTAGWRRVVGGGAKVLVSANSMLAASAAPENAIDGNLESIWHVKTDYGGPDKPAMIRFDFDAAHPEIISRLRAQPRRDAPEQFWKTALVQASNDGTQWETLSQLHTGKPPEPGRWIAWRWNNGKAFTSYRLVIPSGFAAGHFLSVAEIELYAH